MSSTTTRPPRSPGALVADAVAELEDAAVRLAQLAADGAFAEVPDAALSGLTEAMHHALDRGTAAATVATGVVHSSGALTVEGFASTKAWLQGPCRRSGTEAKVLLASSAALRGDFAATRQAWLAGEVSGGAVREITRSTTLAVKALPVAERVERRTEAEEILLGVARTSPVADVTRAGKYLRFVTDPDGARLAQLDAYDDQHLSLTPVGAGFELRGYLAAETAAALTTALDGIVDGWYRAGSLTPEDRPGTSRVLDDRRKRARRPHLLALALGHLASRVLDGGCCASGTITRCTRAAGPSPGPTASTRTPPAAGPSPHHEPGPDQQGAPPVTDARAQHVGRSRARPRPALVPHTISAGGPTPRTDRRPDASRTGALSRPGRRRRPRR